LFQGEKAVILPIRIPERGVLPLVFHPQCFIKWSEEKFLQRFHNWELQTTPPERKPKRGRPRKYKNYVQAYRLRCLINYYRRTRNEEKVRELEAELEELKLW